MEATEDRLEKALDLAAGWVRDGVVPGVAVAVARDGRVVAERVAGKLAAGGGGPVDADSLFPLGILTMPFTAAAYLRLVERGLATLDEPIRRLVPSVAGDADAADKRELTARDLLCHLGGLPPEVPGAGELWAREASFDEWVAAAAAAPLVARPGERVLLSRTGYWLLGAAIAAAVGMPFAEVLQDEVLRRFDLGETLLVPGLADQGRIARRYGRDRALNAASGRALGSPAVGLFGSARDLARFASVFLAGGLRPDGRRALATAAVEAMTTDQAAGRPGGLAPEESGAKAADAPAWSWPAAGWGLGWEIKGGKRGHWSGDLTGQSTFAHPGDAGALVWADPASGIACAVVANRDLATGWTNAPARWARLGNAVVAALTAGDGWSAVGKTHTPPLQRAGALRRADPSLRSG